MKSKVLVTLSTLILAVGLMAQTATQTTPAPSGVNNSCTCCNHHKDGTSADAKTSCCGKDGNCCKDGRCAMSSKDGKDTMSMSADGKTGMKCPVMSGDKASCCGKDGGCCKEGKCNMATNKGKSCCGGNKCARPQAGV